jgi:hypothetical protein
VKGRAPRLQALRSAYIKGGNMKLGSRRTILGVLATVVVCLLGAALAGGQAGQAPAQGQPMAEQVYKNVQVLRGIPADEFLGTMGFIAAATGLNCTHCHSGNDYTVEAYAEDTIPLKQTARMMFVMMNTINRSFFQGRQVVTCWTCHQGEQVPRTVPNLNVQYGAPEPYEPDDALEQAFGQPAPDEVLDKYIQALGGAQRVNALTSLVGRGTNTGFGPEATPRPMELYARAPRQRTVITHTADGDSTETFDGQAGWSAVPHKVAPDPVLALTEDDLAGVKLDAELMFPGQIKQYLIEWRTGFPFTLGDRDLIVVQGRTGPGRPLVKLMFDDATGLLVRQTRYLDSPVGKIPTQIDYEDYREIPGTGVKMPFKWTVMWTYGRETFQLTQVQANAQIPAARFAKPAPPMAPAPRAAAQ